MLPAMPHCPSTMTPTATQHTSACAAKGTISGGEAPLVFAIRGFAAIPARSGLGGCALGAAGGNVTLRSSTLPAEQTEAGALRKAAL